MSLSGEIPQCVVPLSKFLELLGPKAPVVRLVLGAILVPD